MSISSRFYRVVSRCLSLSVAFTTVVALGTASQAQSGSNNGSGILPQLLPYTAKLIAGSGTANPAKGGNCPISGDTALDAAGDGCFATEILLGTSAAAPGPRSAVGDAAGNVFFTDYANATVRRVDAITGIVTVVAGGGTNAAGTAVAALGTAVKLVHPAGIAFAPNGDLYFSDPGNGQVFKIASTGGVAGVSPGVIGGSVGSVVITNGGTGYTVAPVVTFSAPPAGGTPATGTATISGGVVTGVTVVTAGTGYTAPPTVSFTAPVAGNTATAIASTTGVISLVAGNSAGTFGYAASNATTIVTAANSYLRAIYGIAFDTKGDLFMVDEYTEAILVLNTNTTGTNTVNTVAVPAGQIWKVAGTYTNTTTNPNVAPYCLNGTATGYGCTYGLYTENIPANTDSFDSTYSVAADGNGVIYGGLEYYDSVFKVTPDGLLSTFAGKQNAAAKSLMRAPAGTFGIGSVFGVAADANSNVYIGDASSGVIWRVDGPVSAKIGVQNMYVVAGGVGDTGGATAICSTATDALGDGCPATQATLGHSGTSLYATTTLPGPGIYGVSVDKYSNLFFGDTENNDVREISSGTQFGPVGAGQPTQNVDIHFASGDMPASTNPYTLTSGATNFSLGTATCTNNSDGTKDCILPITATPTALGPFSGMLQVTAQIGGSASFALSGTYIQSPITRTTLSYTAGVSCTGTTTYATSTPVTLTATVIANGPNPPVGTADTITFFANNGTTTTTLGTVPVSNIGTASNPVYGATLTNTFANVGTYTLTATYSGDTYFKSSTGKANTTITTATPAYTVTATPYMQSTVTAGQTALYSFNVNFTVYTGNVSFACSGLPANSSCVFSPTTITASGCSTTSTIALSVLTTPRPTPTSASLGSTGRGPWAAISILAGLGLALLIGIRRKRIPLHSVWMALALLVASSGLMACNSVTINAPPATPTGTYTVTVTTTSSAGAATTITVPLTVN